MALFTHLVLTLFVIVFCAMPYMFRTFWFIIRFLLGVLLRLSKTRSFETLCIINQRNAHFLNQCFNFNFFLMFTKCLPECSSSGRLLYIQLWYGMVQCLKFKVCKSVHHHRFQINQSTRCNNFSSLLLDVYVQLNVFRASSRPSSGAQQLQ